VTYSHQQVVDRFWQILYVPETTAFLESLVSSPSTPGLKPTAPPASPDYDLGFDVQLRYLCKDAQWPWRPARFATLAATTESFAPYVGPKWTYIGFPCVAWTTRAPGRYLGPWNRTTPLLLVNFRYDPATPLSSAVGTARALADTRLITIEGWGHRFFNGSRITGAQKYEVNYLLERKLPPARTTCQADSTPFR
jgi:pimeloyl-ACP methyl ester carboxylesterase